MTTSVEEKVADPVFELLKWEPTKSQEPILYSSRRFILVTGGEQAGKSLVASKYFARQYFADLDRHPGSGDGQGSPLVYWLVGPAYGETQEEFNYIQDDLRTLGLPVKASTRVDPGYIEVKFPEERRARLRLDTKSATDIRRLSRVAPHGIIMCEPGQMDIQVYERCQGRSTPQHGWLFMAGTLESGSGWYAQLGAAWQSGADDRQSFALPSYSNVHLYPGGRSDPKILELERNSSDDFFLERIEGLPVPPRGLVFGDFRADMHVKDVNWVPGEPVNLRIDPGYAGAYAVEAQQVINGVVHNFDEIYETGLVTEQIIDIAMSRQWWQDVPEGSSVIDIAGLQHQAMAAPAEVWMKRAGLYLASNRIRINDGTERLKSFLKPDPITRVPKIVFAPRCRGILSEFGAHPSPIDGQTHVYRWKTDKEGAIVGETPEDKYNHGIKAIIYGLIDQYGYAHMGRRRKMKVVHY